MALRSRSKENAPSGLFRQRPRVLVHPTLQRRPSQGTSISAPTTYQPRISLVLPNKPAARSCNAQTHHRNNSNTETRSVRIARNAIPSFKCRHPEPTIYHLGRPMPRMTQPSNIKGRLTQQTSRTNQLRTREETQPADIQDDSSCGHPG